MISNKSEIAERIRQLVAFKEISKTDFGFALGYKSKFNFYYILNLSKEIDIDFIERLNQSEISKDVSLLWLLTGEGAMIDSSRNTEQILMMKFLSKSKPEPVIVKGVRQNIIKMQERNEINSSANILKEAELLNTIHLKENVYKILKRDKRNKTWLAKKMGLKPNSITVQLSKQRLKIHLVQEYANALGITIDNLLEESARDEVEDIKPETSSPVKDLISIDKINIVKEVNFTTKPSKRSYIDPFTDRLRLVIGHFDLTITRFADLIGFQNVNCIGVVLSGTRKPGRALCVRLMNCDQTRLISLNWLFTGEKDMFTDDFNENKLFIENKFPKVEKIEKVKRLRFINKADREKIKKKNKERPVLNLDTSLPDRLKHIIESKGLVIEEFALILGYTNPRSLMYMLAGTWKPSFKLFEGLSNNEITKDISMDWLITGKGNMFKQ